MIGPPPTLYHIFLLVRIGKDVTRFGRHSDNDYYLDSALYVCLISRWHAELHRVEQGGQRRYMIRDNSMNGTYVNNVRVSTVLPNPFSE